MKGKMLLTATVFVPLIVFGFGVHTPTTLASEASDDTPLSDVATASAAMFEGCPAGFWRGAPEDGSEGGRWLWNDVIDPEWSAAGGQGANPNIWIYGFNTYFTPMPELTTATMMSILDESEQVEDYEKAAGALVAAYLNASWGMAYPYSTEELGAKWDTAVRTGNFLDLQTELEHANNAAGGCPVPTSAE